jgi:predicted glycoside hydrolase/deacetylase ChbG (UPF0249 family)
LLALVIVNADDLGMTVEVSDRILACFSAQVISSASLMVWMNDSDRAATLGREASLPIGLHLNLDDPFAVDVPIEVRSAHDRVRSWFASRPRFLSSFNLSRSFHRDLRTSITAQLDEFQRLVGCDPTHIDSHHHVHMNWNVLCSSALQAMTPVRTTRWVDAKPSLRILRSSRIRLIRRRFISTDLFFDLRHISPALGGTESFVSNSAPATTIEIMTHPGMPDEFAVLNSAWWREVTDGLPLGSFADLAKAEKAARSGFGQEDTGIE